jgi:hypothetical protein
MAKTKTKLVPENRIKDLKEKITNITDTEEIMLLIMDALKEVEFIPEVGKYYTFLYNPKTPDIQYDQHPLIACLSVEKWGFRGLNYHWQKQRNYSWIEVIGQLHIVYKNELNDLLAIPYAKYLTK